ncbi:MAG: alpha/beta hydrolase [Burkholderiales bacterium]
MPRTTLVLLPGLDGTEIFFGPLLAHLPSWIDPVVVTYPASGPNTYDSLATIVDAAVDGLANFVILGWSFGGPLALMVAARMPTQVSGVVLCGSFVTPPHPSLVPFRYAVIGPVVAVVRAIRRLRLLMPGRATTELRAAKAITWRRVHSGTLAARARAVLNVDARALLAACNSRILYLMATEDEVISRANLDTVLAISPKTEVAEIEGPHMALFTNPSQSAARIVDFLQKRQMPDRAPTPHPYITQEYSGQ